MRVKTHYKSVKMEITRGSEKYGLLIILLDLCVNMAYIRISILWAASHATYPIIPPDSSPPLLIHYYFVN